MAAGDQHVVGLEQVDALAMDVLVGDDVVLEAEVREPVLHIHVEDELARVGRVLAGAGPGRLRLGPHVEDRAEP